MYPQSMFWSKKKKNIKNLKFSIFKAQKICFLHGHVFVMHLNTLKASELHTLKHLKILKTSELNTLNIKDKMNTN